MGMCPQNHAFRLDIKAHGFWVRAVFQFVQVQYSPATQSQCYWWCKFKGLPAASYILSASNIWKAVSCTAFLSVQLACEITVVALWCCTGSCLFCSCFLRYLLLLLFLQPAVILVAEPQQWDRLTSHRNCTIILDYNFIIGIEWPWLTRIFTRSSKDIVLHLLVKNTLCTCISGIPCWSSVVADRKAQAWVLLTMKRMCAQKNHTG